MAFNLLPILLSRIKALGESQVHEVTVLLRRLLFPLIKNDPLELEKVKAMQAIEEFLKVRFLFNLLLFSGADNSDSDRKKAMCPCLFRFLVRLLGGSGG